MVETGKQKRLRMETERIDRCIRLRDVAHLIADFIGEVNFGSIEEAKRCAPFIRHVVGCNQYQRGGEYCGGSESSED